MISNQNLIFYACIAKGSTIVAEFVREPGLEALAQKCIEKTPSHHSMFSHTFKKRTYTFVIDDPFVYFAIFDDDLDKSEGLWFLNRIKNAFEEKIESGSIKDSDNLAPGCFQGQVNSIFRETLMLDFGLVDSPAPEREDTRNPSLDSSKGKKTAMAPLLGKPIKGLKKKKRLEHNMEACDNKGNVVGCRDFPVPMHKNVHALYPPGTDRQKAKQVWKKHVWVVLMLDLCVCSVLFGVWLWVCRGLQCIDG